MAVPPPFVSPSFTPNGVLRRRTNGYALVTTITIFITSKKAEKLRVAQRAMERAMLGISLRDRVRNEQVRRLSKVEDVIERIAKAKWQWAGHVARGDQEKWTTKLMQWRPRTSRRSAGRPQKRWVDDIKEVTGPMWQKKAQDRAQW